MGTSLISFKMTNLKSRAPLFSSVKVQVFRVPFIMEPKLMNEAGEMLYLLNKELTDTRMGMLAMVSPPSQTLGSIT